MMDKIAPQDAVALHSALRRLDDTNPLGEHYTERENRILREYIRSLQEAIAQLPSVPFIPARWFTVNVVIDSLEDIRNMLNETGMFASGQMINVARVMLIEYQKTLEQ